MTTRIISIPLKPTMTTLGITISQINKMMGRTIPGDVRAFLKDMTSFREEVNSGTPQEWGELVREEADRSAELCHKYGITYHQGDEEDDMTGLYRSVYSDGSKGDWE